MKKPGTVLLLCLTLVFLSFLLGFFVGRNQTGPVAEIQIADLPAPTETESAEPAEETEPSQPQYPIDINTADLSALTALPGIGPVLAQRIIDYRDANGAYSSVYDLLNVEGIGEQRLEDLLPYATIGG